jgi:siroheme synthase-like protein
VVGGGQVATRKAAGLAACGAVVTVIAPDVAPAIEALAATLASTGPGSVAIVRRRYQEGDAGRYRLVVTATGIRQVDGMVADDAEAAGVWVNSADDAEHCTFQLPSVHRDGPVSIAVSTGGASPAFATWLRRRTGQALGPELGTLAELLYEARRSMQAEGRSTELVDWQALLDGPLPGLVREGRLDAARALLASATGLDTHGR